MNGATTTSVDDDDAGDDDDDNSVESSRRHGELSHHVDDCVVILAVDIGSSSIRCTAYALMNNNDDNQASCSAGAPVVVPVSGCSSSISRQSVQPNTGKIKLLATQQGSESCCSLLQSVDDVVEEVLSKLRKTGGAAQSSSSPSSSFTVAAVGFSCFVMNLVAVDCKTGNLVGDDATLSYACNTSEAIEECRELQQQLGPEKLQQLYQTTGAPLHTSYAIPQLRALYRKKDDSALTTSQQQHDIIWQTLDSHIIARWMGQTSLPISYSSASWTGLLNVTTCDYEQSAIHLLPEACQDALPPLVDYTDFILEGIPQYVLPTKNNREAPTKDVVKTEPATTAAGTVTKAMASNPYWTKFPELRDCQFFLGIGDGACANVGSKCTTATRIAVTIGTSAAARMCLYHPMSSTTKPTAAAVPSSPLSSSSFLFEIPKFQGLFCYRIDKYHVLVGGALTDGGSVVEWARTFLNLTSEQDFQRCLTEVQELEDKECALTLNESDDCSREQVDNQQHLIMVPFLSGERSTGFRFGATGAVLGLTRETTPASFFRSCMEGVSLRLATILDLIVACNMREGTKNDNDTLSCKPIMVASGKAMESNDMWRQMIADSSGLCVVLDKDTEEGTSRGVAQLVALALKGLKLSSCKEEIKPFKNSQPRTERTFVYKKKLVQQSTLIGSIAPMFFK